MCSNLPLISLSIRFQCCPSSHAPSFHRCAWLLPARVVTRCSSSMLAHALGGMVTQVQTVVSVRGDTDMMSPLPLLAVENLNTPLASHHAIVTALPDARPPDVDPPVRRSSCARARVAVVPLCEGATLLLCCCFLVCQSFSSPHLMCFVRAVHFSNPTLSARGHLATSSSDHTTRVARPSA